MVQKLLSKRPILVGGLGLAAGLSLLGGLQDLADSTALASLIAAGTGIWWWRRQNPPADVPEIKPVMPVERDVVKTAIASLKPALHSLQKELESLESAAAAIGVAELEARQQGLLQELDRTQLNVAIVGHSRSGKSSLIRRLSSLTTTPISNAHAESDDSGSEASAPTPTLTLMETTLTPETPHPDVMAGLQVNQDAVIYLVTEDLTESALADLRRLTSVGQRIIVGFNKQDTFLPKDRDAILEQIQSRLRGLPLPVEGVAIATDPNPIKVRTFDAAGKMTERVEAGIADVSPMAAILTTWLADEVPHLVAQTVMRQVQQLRQDIQTQLNQVRHQKALPVIEQLQWTAAATAFASPMPSLDLVAAIAINGQLVMDLGRIYQQPLALDQAKTIASELAAVVVKLGIVEVSSQLLTTALKSHAATFVVGGSVQAFSAAYLTQLSGESLMAYFEERALSGRADTELSVDAIGQKLQTLLPQTQRKEFLQNLITRGIQKLTPKPTPALTAGETPAVEIPQNAPTTITVQSETVSSTEPAYE